MHTSSESTLHFAEHTAESAQGILSASPLSHGQADVSENSQLKWRGALAQALAGVVQQGRLQTQTAPIIADSSPLPDYLQQVSTAQPLATQAQHLARLHELSVALSISITAFHWCNCAHKQPLSWRNNGSDIAPQVLANGLHFDQAAAVTTAHDETQLMIDMYGQPPTFSPSGSV